MADESSKPRRGYVEGVGYTSRTTDINEFVRRLAAIVAGEPPATPGQPNPPLNSMIQEMGGRDGGPSYQEPTDSSFLDAILNANDSRLQDLLTRPINPGGPPSSEIGPNPQSGPNSEVSDFLLELLQGNPILAAGQGQESLLGRGTEDQPLSFRRIPPTGEEAPGELPPISGERGFGAFREKNRISDFLVALELMNQGLQDRGQSSVEWGQDPMSTGAGGFRDWVNAQVEDPARTDYPAARGENSLNKRTRENKADIKQFVSPVKDLLVPDTASYLLDNPGGKITDFVTELLKKTGLRRTEDVDENGNPITVRVGNSADVNELRTRQINSLLTAGPDRGSLIDPKLLSPEEAALARQLGGVDKLATQYPDILGRDPQSMYRSPSEREDFLQAMIRQIDREGNAALEGIAPGLSEHLYPEAGTDPWQKATRGAARYLLTGLDGPLKPTLSVEGHRPVDTSGAEMPSEDIASNNRSIFDALMGALPTNDPEVSDTLREPSSARDPQYQPRPLSILDQLMGALTAQRTGNGQYNFPPEPGTPPEYPTRLDEMLAREEGSPLAPNPFGNTPDMLEGRPNGNQIGLDEAGNIRFGGPSGQVISSLPVDLGPINEGMRTPDFTGTGLDKLPLPGMRGPEMPIPAPDTGMTPPQIPMPMPGPGMSPMPMPFPMPLPGMRTPGQAPGPEGMGLPGLDFIQALLGGR